MRNIDESYNNACVEISVLNFRSYLSCLGIGDDVVIDVVEKNGFFLLIPKGVNNPSKDIFYVVSMYGHDSIAVDEKSVHQYQVVDGSGYFEIDGVKTNVEPGSLITIYPNQKFYYNGNMSMIEIIAPNFDDTKFHIIELVDYSNRFVK